jgi:hypothetical protein
VAILVGNTSEDMVDKARWGNIMFNTSTSYNGGKVINKVGADISTVVQSLSNEVGSTSTPLLKHFILGCSSFHAARRLSPAQAVTKADAPFIQRPVTRYDPIIFIIQMGPIRRCPA